ncbi:hypothetical protein BV22DRAFT_342674 [Leucogyrophana mollusca]|uniref:Uncharacterized protein n=1 Tax=Leucogyrophana mollusca TaxID=85980 RepID=A0ACB8BM68_9AGAM|nr:hypothetical protein BV22DRAFT_342674 [Leucogyrophana mollusca]
MLSSTTYTIYTRMVLLIIAMGGVLRSYSKKMSSGDGEFKTAATQYLIHEGAKPETDHSAPEKKKSGEGWFINRGWDSQRHLRSGISISAVSTGQNMVHYLNPRNGIVDILHHGLDLTDPTNGPSRLHLSSLLENGEAVQRLHPPTPCTPHRDPKGFL